GWRAILGNWVGLLTAGSVHRRIFEFLRPPRGHVLKSGIAMPILGCLGVPNRAPEGNSWSSFRSTSSTQDRITMFAFNHAIRCRVARGSRRRPPFPTGLDDLYPPLLPP